MPRPGRSRGFEAGSDGHLIDDAQVWDVADTIPDGSAAAIALIEHVWAKPLRATIARAGGVVVSGEFIHPLDLLDVGLLTAVELDLETSEEMTGSVLAQEGARGEPSLSLGVGARESRLQMTGAVQVTRPQASRGGWVGSCSSRSARSSAEDVVRRLTRSLRSPTWSSPSGPGSEPRPGELAEALRDGRLLRTFAFRGAAHLLTPEEGGAYLALRAAGRQWELPSWRELYGSRRRTGRPSGTRSERPSTITR